MTTPEPREAAPLIFGEVLFDEFADDQAVLGGAPFNVAWHLRGFGLSPTFVSSVGKDARGDRVLKAMRAWGLPTDCVQQHPTRPTGTVHVDAGGGVVRFDIEARQAYDDIQPGPAADCISNASPVLLYHGSLVTREAGSREALDRLIHLTDLPVFLDVNLRAPWWDPADVRQLMHRATWLKLNDGELVELAGLSDDGRASLVQAAQAFLNEFDLKTVIVTRGAEGAFVVAHDLERHSKPEPVEVVDTVGAGDAFSSVIIMGIVREWPVDLILTRALRFAASICMQRGATAPDTSLYRHHLAEWD